MRATFFQCGTNVARLPDIARAVRDAGHEIGNHTYSHARLLFRKPGEIYQEFARAQEVICAETGVTPTLVRVPYGMNWYGMGAAQRKLGLIAVSWTVIGHDWEWPARRIAERVLKAVTPGGIICLHDGRDTRPNPNISEMLDALRIIVPALQDRGYNFETVSEILRLSPEPDPDGDAEQNPVDAEGHKAALPHPVHKPRHHNQRDDE